MDLNLGQTGQSAVKRNWVLSPSDFAFLWEECRRCFYLKVARNLPRPQSAFPRVFRVIDAEMKARYAGQQTADAMPFLPSGIIDPSDSWIISVPLSITGCPSTCNIRGKLDTVVRFTDHSYAVIDFKTAETRGKQIPLYSRQLHAYAFGLENAAPGGLSLSPVTMLGLVVFEPKTFSGGNNSPASLTGPVSWIEIRRDNSGFLSFLNEVVAVLERPTPPEASRTCEWCQYRDASRRTGL
jgi:hypothetical protein